MDKESSSLLTQFSRLLANWPLDDERKPRFAQEYRTLFQSIGTERFTAAVSAIIQERKSPYFPNLGEFREYIPEQTRTWGMSDQEYSRLSADRKDHPEEYFGSADVICAMRIMQSPGGRNMTPKQIIDEVIEVRKALKQQQKEKNCA